METLDFISSIEAQVAPIAKQKSNANARVATGTTSIGNDGISNLSTGECSRHPAEAVDGTTKAAER